MRQGKKEATNEQQRTKFDPGGGFGFTEVFGSGAAISEGRWEFSGGE